MIDRTWQALTTWLDLAQAYEASSLASRLGLNARFELLKEKIRSKHSSTIRVLPCGFKIRRNSYDMGVLLSMPLEYGIVEWNFSSQCLRVVDLGANIGAFAFYVGCFADVERYVGIEAAPANFAVLEKNADLLGECPVVRQCAVVHRTAEVAMNLMGNPSRFALSSDGEKVQGYALDDIPEVGDLPLIDIMKIDVEGAEHDALRGAERTLAKTRCVVMEIHRAKLGDEAVEEIFSKMNAAFDHVVYHQSPDRRQSNVLFRRRGNSVFAARGDV